MAATALRNVPVGVRHTPPARTPSHSGDGGTSGSKINWTGNTRDHSRTDVVGHLSTKFRRIGETEAAAAGVAAVVAVAAVSRRAEEKA